MKCIDFGFIEDSNVMKRYINRQKCLKAYEGFCVVMIWLCTGGGKLRDEVKEAEECQLLLLRIKVSDVSGTKVLDKMDSKVNILKGLFERWFIIFAPSTCMFNDDQKQEDEFLFHNQIRPSIHLLTHAN